MTEADRIARLERDNELLRQEMARFREFLVGLESATQREADAKGLAKDAMEVNRLLAETIRLIESQQQQWLPVKTSFYDPDEYFNPQTRVIFVNPTQPDETKHFRLSTGEKIPLLPSPALTAWMKQAGIEMEKKP